MPITSARIPAIALISATACCCASSIAFAAGPFTGFAGDWRGKGSISMTDGSREAIRCKAVYAVNGPGTAMNINVNCASDSYRVNIVGSVMTNGRDLSGQWQETTRGVQGSVTGQVPGPGEMQASLEGTGFGIQLSARASGKSQTVSVRSEGTDVRSVAITLKR